MSISESKMKIVIDNYFKSECDVNTSIREAFEKGFRIGVQKGMQIQPDSMVEVTRCRECYFRVLDGADIPVCTGAMAYSHTPNDWFCAAGKPKDGE